MHMYFKIFVPAPYSHFWGYSNLMSPRVSFLTRAHTYRVRNPPMILIPAGLIAISMHALAQIKSSIVAYIRRHEQHHKNIFTPPVKLPIGIQLR